jgi:hypothetical protein
MEYKKKLSYYRLQTEDKRIIKFIDFLETVFEWIETLLESRRLRDEQKDDIDKNIPKFIFQLLDQAVLHNNKASDSDLNEMKVVLLKETKVCVFFIIRNGNLKMSDFDLLQFNLYQIFGKEELASLIEGARLYLKEVQNRRERRRIKLNLEKIKKEKEYQEKIKSMTPDELKKFAVSNMFDFTHSARTDIERLASIKNNRDKVRNQKLKFRHFERKLVDATKEAREESQNIVYRKLGEVRRSMNIVTQEFVKKARIFVSEEGPKKKIMGARIMITGRKKKLNKSLEGQGKKWEKRFREQTEIAQGIMIIKRKQFFDDMNEKAERLESHFENEVTMAQKRINIKEDKFIKDISQKGAEWKSRFKSETQDARHRILGEKGKLNIVIERKGRQWKSGFLSITNTAREKIQDQRLELSDSEDFMRDKIKRIGISELEGAKGLITEGRKYFEEDVESAKANFSEKVDDIGDARNIFKSKRDDAQHRFTDRGVEVENEILSTLDREKGRYISERETARSSFIRRSGEIESYAVKYITGKRENFKRNREIAQGKFIKKSDEIKGKVDYEGEPAYQTKRFSSQAVQAKGKIEHGHHTMVEQADINRERMKEEMMHRRELFKYDIRFARHSMEEHAKKFTERIEIVKEEFETRQEQIIRRHKAHQKAHIINNLLRTIRGMQNK